ncbi:MAG: hypothetical protein PHH75_05400 [Candidatus Omnitrophica bacterium]|nr:hypothetical protein [Candidatus Omnitrophota bacterium]
MMSAFRGGKAIGAVACVLFLAVSGLQAQENEEGAVPEAAMPALEENAPPDVPVVLNQMEEVVAPEAMQSQTAEAAPPPQAQEGQGVAQEEPAAAQDPGQKPVPAPVETVPAIQVMEIKDEEAPTEWVWGEVVSVDPSSSSITIKHLDYNTYEEVKTVLKLKDKTLFENVKDATEIAPGDHITADYRMQAGQSMVEMIVVDRPAAGQPKDDSSPVEEPAAAVPAKTASEDIAVDAVATPVEDTAQEEAFLAEEPIVEQPSATDMSIPQDEIETAGGSE